MFRSDFAFKGVSSFVAILILSSCFSNAFSQEQTKVSKEWSDQIKFRSIGPANMMGRITALAVYEEDPCIWWAASASGGLLKTTNNGINFEHQFDDQPTVSIGDVQVAQSDKNIVWVGTGESNPRNSVSWGDGVYKSTDGGETWKNMGLEKTFQTGAIAIHPKDPNIVYVGSLGRLWGPNPERGLFKTTDGGENWKKILYVNDKTGVVDVQINPKNPDEVLIATYERQRDGFDGNDPEKKYGEGSAIYRTIDAGESFKRITDGLPSCKLGRIGLDYYRKNPKYVFAIIETEMIAKEPKDSPYMGLRAEDAEVGARVTDITADGPSDKAGLKEGDIVVSVDRAIVHSNAGMLAEVRKKRAGDKVKLVVSRDRKQVDIELALSANPRLQQSDAQKTAESGEVVEGSPPAEAGAGERGARRGPRGAGRGERGAGRGERGAGRGERGAGGDEPVAGGEEETEASDKKVADEEKKAEGEAAKAEASEEKAADEEKKAEGEAAKAAGDEKAAASDEPGRAAGGARGARSGRSAGGRARTRTPRSPFTGTLGGQAANFQEQQGKDGHEYGGVYMSSDGGDTWKRINSLNPRPMYYSHIRVDPTDRQRVYVCGTSLYKSEDGGKTFTGDGGSDGIHVDHHALWIDPGDGRHMILGNDGGIYVTYDRMTHWDHHNHAAIGQFYHVGVDANMNYNVYGGLQDNGSWGGPSRSAAGGGTINSDWFRVGGGDGFITLVDPEDSDQIYFESQNGGMGRINLRTGERGFIRPRPPRGTRYRFNWKSPFVLSPHNSKVFYSAGNHVFRSLSKGDKISAISPEITNTDKGAGSAITESPVEPGVIYVGTTDGAVWMTKDGGLNWVALYHIEEKKEAEAEAESESKSDEPEAEKETTEAKKDQPEAKEEPAAESTEKEPAAEPAKAVEDPLTGDWTGKLVSDRIPADRSGFEFSLKLNADGSVSGEMENRRGDLMEFDGGKFDPKTGAISWVIESERGDREYSGTLKDGEITGEMSAGGGRFQIEFEAKRDKDEPVANSALTRVFPIASNSVIALLQLSSASADDPISGKWNGVLEDENLPNGRIEFTLELEMDKESKMTGRVSSPAGEAEIVEGKYDAEKKHISMIATNEDESMELQFEADVSGLSMTGTLNMNEQFEVDFDAEKEDVEEEPETAEPETAEPSAQEQDDEPKAAPKTSDEMKSEEAAKPAAAAAAADDPVSGEWKGEFETPRGNTEFSMTLVRKADQTVTGSYTTERGEGEITEGKYNPETKQLSVLSDNGRFTLEFIGEVEADKFVGEVQFNSGQFSMEFTAERESKIEAPAETESAASSSAKSGEKSGDTLADLMPGPRWVSSLEASRFKAERCYISFDGHRSNDDEPYLFMTDDYGKSWKSIRGDLPTSAGSVRVLREDVKNENLLYLGCEFSAWFSIDRGQSWNRFTGLPTVSVHEFAVHPKAGDVVVGTHGRAIWIADVSILQQMTPETVKADAHLYKPKDVIRWRQAPGRGNNGTREFKGEDPPSGTTIAYSLGKTARNIELTVFDVKGDVIRRFEPSSSKGLHTIPWDLRLSGGGGRGGPAGRGGRGRGRSVATGSYLVELRVDGKRFSETVTVQPDPDRPADAVAEDEELLYWLELGESAENDK